MLRYAARHPERIVPHARRLARDMALRLKNRDHVSYYRAVMKSDVARCQEGAVGSHTHESWLKIGQMQFDYLVAHGLKPGMRMLDIGCGNLRAGRLLIDYLEAGGYYGIDISPDILLAAQRTLAEAGLQDKLPHLTLVQDLKLAFLPAEYFDVVHAHSVFSHSPIEIIEECLAHVCRVMKPGGFFDFTFDRTEGAEHQVLHEDFYYRTETLVALARRYGLTGRFMADWEELPHQQCKLRVTRPEDLRSISIAAVLEPASSSRSQRARSPTTTLAPSELPGAVRGHPLASAGVCCRCYSFSYSPGEVCAYRQGRWATGCTPGQRGTRRSGYGCSCDPPMLRARCPSGARPRLPQCREGVR